MMRSGHQASRLKPLGQAPTVSGHWFQPPVERPDFRPSPGGECRSVDLDRIHGRSLATFEDSPRFPPLPPAPLRPPHHSRAIWAVDGPAENRQKRSLYQSLSSGRCWQCRLIKSGSPPDMNLPIIAARSDARSIRGPGDSFHEVPKTIGMAAIDEALLSSQRNPDVNGHIISGLYP